MQPQLPFDKLLFFSFLIRDQISIIQRVTRKTIFPTRVFIFIVFILTFQPMCFSSFQLASEILRLFSFIPINYSDVCLHLYSCIKTFQPTNNNDKDTTFCPNFTLQYPLLMRTRILISFMNTTFFGSFANLPQVFLAFSKYI